MKTNDIAYQNKDIASKTFAERFPKESLEVYGLHLPKIVNILPTNLPQIAANELRIDNLFELEDGSLAIIDYESCYKSKQKLKYLDYVIRIAKRYRKRENLLIRVIVLYTADVKKEETSAVYKIGAVTLRIEQAFLSELDSAAMKNHLTTKIKRHEILTNKELMEFVILPLTYKGKQKKQESIHELFEVAKEIEDETTQIFLLTGVMIFSDKVIDNQTAGRMKEWIMMTKVARLFEQEKQEAIKKTTEEVTKEVTRETAISTAKAMIRKGLSVDTIEECISDLNRKEIEQLMKETIK